MFLPGGITLEFVVCCQRVPGDWALPVALLLVRRWYLSNREKSFLFNQSTAAADLNVDRKTVFRALGRLTEAGIIAIENQQRGKNRTIRFLVDPLHRELAKKCAAPVALKEGVEIVGRDFVGDFVRRRE